MTKWTYRCDECICLKSEMDANFYLLGKISLTTCASETLSGQTSTGG